MSNERMAGNPHYALSYGKVSPEWSQVEAMRALAYEQRTANLIAYQANVEASYARLRTPQRRSEQASALNKQIIALLGLSEVAE